MRHEMRPLAILANFKRKLFVRKQTLEKQLYMVLIVQKTIFAEFTHTHTHTHTHTQTGHVYIYECKAKSEEANISF